MPGPQQFVEPALKAAIDEKYPPGWFVAVAQGQILAAESDFHGLESALQAQGRDPCSVLVLEAGAATPTNVTIFI